MIFEISRPDAPAAASLILYINQLLFVTAAGTRGALLVWFCCAVAENNNNNYKHESRSERYWTVVRFERSVTIL